METIAVVGLGYVGLPLALAFGQLTRTIGIDTDVARIKALESGQDPTGESPSNAFEAAQHVVFTGDAGLLRDADFVIITVPTPVTDARQPDLGPLKSAASSVGQHLKKGAVVVLESTVYPGLTDEVLAPLIEQASGLKRGEDFKLAYSPERINPGDREHSLRTTVKVVSAEDPQTLDRVAALYERVVEAGVYRAKSIKVAEAAKVIENTQRDLNIALMNELAIIFHRLGIDTLDVLETAGTKWNFLPFRPGLVGGHCIGVDPYYLTYKAETVGYHPEVILAGRRINDTFGQYVASRLVKQLIRAGFVVQGARVAVLGIAFKADCPDTRNSRVFDILSELSEYGIQPLVVDPVVDAQKLSSEFGVSLVGLEDLTDVAGTLVAVGHRDFSEIDTPSLEAWLLPGGVVLDLPGLLPNVAEGGLHVERL
ncbi:nucleotide sugar dehydrogenase [Abyssibacter profundi]|uniref:Nucleotide sugar dehydrogenase n=1 Tax=Abyssibacter profundi TaxID=2182787 RepID=A0A363UJ18_9GAMM|nr:nucleotide sugar dehydrogenase [Abyssibacter profundi]PWN55423.1 nucleotide sugar dehydrogenase [Abyssibacter profundi]